MKALPLQPPFANSQLLFFPLLNQAMIDTSNMGGVSSTQFLTAAKECLDAEKAVRSSHPDVGIVLQKVSMYLRNNYVSILWICSSLSPKYNSLMVISDAKLQTYCPSIHLTPRTSHPVPHTPYLTPRTSHPEPHFLSLCHRRMKATQCFSALTAVAPGSWSHTRCSSLRGPPAWASPPYSSDTSSST